MIIPKKARRFLGALILFSIALEGKAAGELKFDSGLSVSEQYTDNFFFTKKDREGEFSTYISPYGRIIYRKQRYLFRVGYEGSLVHYQRGLDDDRFSHRASMDIDFPGAFRNLEIKVVESFTYSPEDPTVHDEQRSVETDEGVQVSRNDTLRNRAGISLSYPWTLRTRTSLSYVNRITRFEDPLLNDSTRHDVDLGLNYRWSPRTQWETTFKTSSFIYKDAENTITYRAGLGPTYDISRTLFLRIRAGFIFFENESPKLYLFSKIQKNYKKGNVQLEVRSDPGSGGGAVSSVTLYQRVGVWGRYNFSPDSYVYLGSFYGRNVSVSNEDLENRLLEANTGARIQVLDWLQAGIRYSYLNQDARGVDSSDGIRNLVIVDLKAVAPTWRIFK